MHRGPGVAPIEEPPLEPVCNADRVECENHLEVVGALCPQADVQLVKVGLQQLRRLLNPDPGDVIDGFELFDVIQSGKEYLGAVGKYDAQLSPVDHGPAVGIVLGNLPTELCKAALPQRPRHLAAHQEPVARLGNAALQHLAPGEDGLARAASALEHQIAAFAGKQRHKSVVAGVPEMVVPDGQPGQLVSCQSSSPPL